MPGVGEGDLPGLPPGGISTSHPLGNRLLWEWGLEPVESLEDLLGAQGAVGFG